MTRRSKRPRAVTGRKQAALREAAGEVAAKLVRALDRVERIQREDARFALGASNRLERLSLALLGRLDADLDSLREKGVENTEQYWRAVIAMFEAQYDLLIEDVERLERGRRDWERRELSRANGREGGKKNLLVDDELLAPFLPMINRLFSLTSDQDIADRILRGLEKENDERERNKQPTKRLPAKRTLRARVAEIRKRAATKI